MKAQVVTRTHRKRTVPTITLIGGVAFIWYDERHLHLLRHVVGPVATGVITASILIALIVWVIKGQVTRVKDTNWAIRQEQEQRQREIRNARNR